MVTIFNNLNIRTLTSTIYVQVEVDPETCKNGH